MARIYTTDLAESGLWDGDCDGPEPEPCDVCGDRNGSDRCRCAPCGDCAKLTDKDSLTWSADSRWRCPKCHQRADVKLLCAERPAFRPNLGHLYLAVAADMMRAR